MRIFLLCILMLSLGCASKKTPTKSEVTAKAYEGLGLESVKPEVLQKFSPQPLSAEISRRVQAMLDIKSPGLGRVSPDGKKMYFSWSVTGVNQVWKMDAPMGFPVQMTGGEDPTSFITFAPNGKFVVLSRDRNGEENPGLYIQDIQGGNLIPIQHLKGIQTFFQEKSKI